MLRTLGENLGLKLIALGTSILIWFYASSERNPDVTKRLLAEVQVIGAAPRDLIVRVQTDPIPVEVNGPRSEVTSLEDGEVKAIVNLAAARANDRELRIVDFKAPVTAPNVTFPMPRPFVPAEVFPRQTKRLQIEPIYRKDNPLGRVYGRPRVTPNWAEAVGVQADLKRVSRLVVYLESRGGNVREDAPIFALDKDDVVVDGVQIEPARARVELNLVEAPATRAMPVSVRLRGSPAPPLVLVEVTVQPVQVTLAGPAEELVQLTNVPTADVNITGVSADAVREIALKLPAGISVVGGADRVRVTVRVRNPNYPQT